MRRLAFNGKFYAGGLNGVHRVADRLIHECDKIFDAMPATLRPEALLYLPKRRGWEPTLRHIKLVEKTRANSQLWEQFELPRLARGAVLVNLANLAPILHRRKMMLIHDVQFLFPDSSYPWRQRVGYRVLVPRMAKTSSVVFSVSQYSRQMMDLTGVCPRTRSQLLYNGVDHVSTEEDATIFDRIPVRDSRYVLMFGSHKSYKNNAVVLNIAARLKEQGIDLVIIGASKQSLIGSGLSVSDDILFAGKTTDAEMAALFRNAFCLAFPSRTEGFGLPPLEAMLFNCPVVAAPAGAIPEICRDSVLYADVDDSGSWYDAILSLADAKIRAAKVELGRARSSEFRWAAAGRILVNEALRLCSA
jgi:glycosyltransferase involved in cell wall biosynthesis